MNPDQTQTTPESEQTPSASVTSTTPSPTPTTFPPVDQPDSATPPPPSNTIGSATLSQAATPPSPQPVTILDEPTDKDRKRVRIVGIAFLAMAVLGIVSYTATLLTPANAPIIAGPVLYIFPLLQAAVAVGLLKYNRIAYIAFNVLAALTILGSLFGVAVSIYALLTVISTPGDLDEPGVLLSATTRTIVQLLPFALAVYGIVVLHPKRVRRLFH